MEEPPGAGRGTGQSPLRAPGGTGTADTLILDVWLQEREKMNLFEPPGVGSFVMATPEPKSGGQLRRSLHHSHHLELPGNHAQPGR